MPSGISASGLKLVGSAKSLRFIAMLPLICLGLCLPVSCKKSGSSTKGPSSPAGETTTEGDTEIEVSGTIKDEVATEFVESSDSVDISGVNLLASTSHVVTAFSLDAGGNKRQIFSQKFASRFFYFKAKVQSKQYLQLQVVRQSDGGEFGALLPPPTADKAAVMSVDRTTTIASKIFDIISDRAKSGKQESVEAIQSRSVSVADVLMVAQSVRRAVDQQAAENSSSGSINLSVLADNIVEKSNAKLEALAAEGQSKDQVADKISDKTYDSVYGALAETAPAGVLAYRTNNELGNSSAATKDVAYEAIKAARSPAFNVVNAAFRVEADAYRSASSIEAATAAESQVAASYQTIYQQCVTGSSSCVSSSYTQPPPPSSSSSGPTTLGTVATPVASPFAGIFTTAQSVELSSTTAGASIYYTLDGSTPSTSSNSILYTGPILVAVSQTIKAVSIKSGYLNSSVATFNYSISGTVAAPTFSVGTGTYSSAQTVSLSSGTPGAIIYYTTDGSTPTRSSSQYAGPFVVASSQTITAFAVRNGWADSSISSASYTVLDPAATPTASPVPGVYTTARSVTLTTATSGATIYYTVDGSVPTTSSSVYSGQIFIGVSQTIKAISVKSGFANSILGSFSYTITGKVQSPQFSLVAGTYTKSQSLILTSPTPGATIFYTTDGFSPSASSNRYTMPIYLSTTQTVRAIAVLANWDDSDVSSSSYTINGPVAAPTFSIEGGIYSSAKSVALSTTTSGAVIYYTTDGSTPSTSSAQYSTAISVATTKTIKAIAVKSGFDDSPIATASYTISTDSVAVTIEFGSDRTTITPSSGSPVVTTAVNSLTSLVSLTAGNPISSLSISGGGTFTISNAQSVWVSSLTAYGSSTVVNIESALANHPSLNVQNGATVGVNTGNITFDSIAVGTYDCCNTAVITTNGYSATWNGSAYSSAPSAGNGQLHLKVNNAVTVGSWGLIQMDGKGYKGGQTLGEAGYSVGGPNTFGAGKGGNSGSPGSYASLPSCSVGGLGSGAVYGASDFWTQLYMGSGGGSRSGSVGGNGGGVIKITAGSLVNSGTIRAEGGNAANAGSGGSGGTIYFSITGSFANNSTISTNGQDCGGYGRVRIDAGTLANSNGTIYGMVHSNVVDNLTPAITSISYTPGQLEIVDNGKTYHLGYLSSTPSQNYNWESALNGRAVGTFTVAGGIVFNFDAASTISVSTLNIRDNTTVVNLNTPFANSPALVVQNGAVVGVNSGELMFESLTAGTECCNTSVITTNGYSATWNGSAYSSAPSAGNGQLHLKVNNAVTVGSWGLIQMDGKGYKGGQTLGEAGYSVGGPNTFGAGKGGNSGSPGSYASLPSCSVGGLGSGAVYGASDFWTQLYMGSGGGSRSGSVGGNGGGVIKITAGSLVNSGTIRAEGGNAANAGSGGSGGTIYFSITGSFANNSTISTNGQDCGGYGRVRIDAGTLANSNGTIYGMVHSNIVENLTHSISSVVYSLGQIEIVESGKTYRMGYISATASQNYAWESALYGKSIDTLTVNGGATLSFNAASSISIGTLNVYNDNTSVDINSVFANNPALNVGNFQVK